MQVGHALMTGFGFDDRYNSEITWGVMVDNDLLRARTTYVLQTIERALGKFTIERAVNSGTEDQVIAIPEVSGGSLKDRIAEGYLSDLFSLALSTTRGSSAHGEVLHLKSLAEALSIYEIRNACAHPNRPFFPHYWYRIATLAQDPSFRMLGIRDVGVALANAESNAFSCGDWTLALRSEIPNNLPSNFEHDRTGLLGRDQAIDQLEKLLTRGRFPTIALVAPGGVGKTALALEVLKKISYSGAVDKIQHVIFVSLKSQRLTASGVQRIDSFPTIDDLRAKLAVALNEAFEDEGLALEELMASRAESPALLCIDNLENVLLNSSLEFDELLEGLPSAWRVLITTRIPINSAHCISLRVLQQPTAGNLAMGYSRSVGLQLSREDCEKIAAICKQNPLAIKITVDAISGGKSIEDALAAANEDTLRFSYDLLLDVLSDNEVVVLEVLFAAGALTRSDIALISELDSDAVAESAGLLARTSLVYSATEQGAEKFALNDAVRELFRTNPRNIELRSDISKRVALRRMQADEIHSGSLRRGDSEHSEYHVPEAHPIALREVSRLLRKGAIPEARLALTKLGILENDCCAVDTFWILKGIALSKFHDPEAGVAFQNAVDIGGSVRAIASLAHWMFVSKKYPEAAAEYIRLKELGGCNSELVGAAIATRNINGLLVSLLYAMKYELVMKMTHEFASMGLRTERMCTTRMSSARMLHHHQPQIEMLCEVFDIYSVAVKSYGVSSLLAKEAMKMIIDMWYCAVNGKLSLKEAEIGSKFIVDNYESIIAGAPSRFITETSWVGSKLLAIADLVPDQALRAEVYRVAGVQETETSGGVVVSIPVRICEFRHSTDRRWRFGVDRDGVRHYLRVEDFNGGWNAWLRLLPQLQVYIVPGAIEEGGDCPRARKVSMSPIFNESV